MLNLDGLIKKAHSIEQTTLAIKNEENKRLNLQEVHIEQFISEKSYDLIESIIEEKRKILVIAPMKAGKSTFSFKELYPVLKACSYQFIFVSPKVSLLEQIQEHYKVISCYGGADCNLNTLPVITTPDSLYKVTRACEEEKRQYIIIYDEIHEMELNYKHRRKLIYPYKYYDNELCMGLVGLTATADNIIKSMKWDRIFKITPNEKFIQTPYTNIVLNLGNGLHEITVHIAKTLRSNDNPLVVRINDKQKITQVKRVLESMGFTSIYTWFRGNENEEDNKMLAEMLNGISCDFNILLTTSLVDVGVELFPMRKPIVVDFMDENSRIIENIQFLGRFREGVGGYHMVVPQSTPLEIEFMEYDTIHSQIEERHKQFADYCNAYWTKERMDSKKVVSNYDIETETYSYECDNFAVNTESFEFYIKQIIRDKDKLQDFLENHFTFNSQTIKQVFVSDEYKTLTENERIIEEIKEEAKAIKNAFKEEFAEFVEFVTDNNNQFVELLTTKEDELPLAEKWRLQNCEEQYSFYWSHEMKDYRKRFYSFRELAKHTYDTRDSLLYILDDKRYREFNKRLAYVEYNYYFDNKKKLLAVDGAYSKVKLIVFGIRSSLIALKGKEVNVKLSNKFLNQLYELCTTKSTFKNMKFSTFEKHVYSIYNLSTDKYRNINSIKSAISFE